MHRLRDALLHQQDGEPVLAVQLGDALEDQRLGREDRDVTLAERPAEPADYSGAKPMPLFFEARLDAGALAVPEPNSPELRR